MTEPRAVVNIWDLIEDPNVPGQVAQRAFARQNANTRGLPPPAIPAEDIPFLARHAQDVKGEAK